MPQSLVSSSSKIVLMVRNSYTLPLINSVNMIEWLFQHVSMVVHHGGAGTTACGLLNARPTVVVAFLWRVSALRDLILLVHNRKAAHVHFQSTFLGAHGRSQQSGP